ncbi:MAG: hypothetical protein M3552_18035 [Planctomycetota bacterium]|nr:hypothetical protein [Planctomycetaceae bacterium]MDQ3332520.1 hypothetical protein [Planctomycetota bacterium]
MKVPTGGHVALALAIGHLAISIALVLWTLDESISRQKRRLPPTKQEQIVDGVLAAMHPLTAVVAYAVNRGGRYVPLPIGLILAIADSLLWGCVSSWATLSLRNVFAHQIASGDRSGTEQREAKLDSGP